MYLDGGLGCGLGVGERQNYRLWLTALRAVPRRSVPQSMRNDVDGRDLFFVLLSAVALVALL